MKIKKGQLVLVRHSRSGNWHGIARENFDTEKDEWYPLNLSEIQREGLNTQWKEGDEIPARRGLCKIEPITNKPKKKIKVSDFGKDHWSLFAYVETRCVDYNGKLDRKHMREDGWEHPTRLKGYFEDKENPERTLKGSSDLNCLKDLENEGFIRIIPNLPDTIELTEEGYKIIGLLRKHKCNGGEFEDFSLKKGDYNEKIR